MVFANGGNCPCSGLPPAGRLGRLGLGSWDDEINDEIFMSLGWCLGKTLASQTWWSCFRWLVRLLIPRKCKAWFLNINGFHDQLQSAMPSWFFATNLQRKYSCSDGFPPLFNTWMCLKLGKNGSIDPAAVEIGENLWILLIDHQKYHESPLESSPTFRQAIFEWMVIPPFLWGLVITINWEISVLMVGRLEGTLHADGAAPLGIVSSKSGVWSPVLKENIGKTQSTRAKCAKTILTYFHIFQLCREQNREPAEFSDRTPWAEAGNQLEAMGLSQIIKVILGARLDLSCWELFWAVGRELCASPRHPGVASIQPTPHLRHLPACLHALYFQKRPQTFIDLVLVEWLIDRLIDPIFVLSQLWFWFASAAQCLKGSWIHTSIWKCVIGMAPICAALTTKNVSSTGRWPQECHASKWMHQLSFALYLHWQGPEDDGHWPQNMCKLSAIRNMDKHCRFVGPLVPSFCSPFPLASGDFQGILNRSIGGTNCHCIMFAKARWDRWVVATILWLIGLLSGRTYRKIVFSYGKSCFLRLLLAGDFVLGVILPGCIGMHWVNYILLHDPFVTRYHSFFAHPFWTGNDQ